MGWSSMIKRKQDITQCSVNIYVEIYNRFDAKLPLKPKFNLSF